MSDRKTEPGASPPNEGSPSKLTIYPEHLAIIGVLVATFVIGVILLILGSPDR